MSSMDFLTCSGSRSGTSSLEKSNCEMTTNYEQEQLHMHYYANSQSHCVVKSVYKHTLHMLAVSDTFTQLLCTCIHRVMNGSADMFRNHQLGELLIPNGLGGGSGILLGSSER